MGLEFDAHPECTGVIVELIVADHGPEIHERLPAIGKNSNEARGQIEVISDWDLVLEGKLCRIGSLVFGELDSDVPL
mgnify:CR=1 FL=1